ncbi:MAG TPA: TonB-dependent receptor [Blastocatellia bacterium]|nr:TonB-dependent receptor [Blastocatellia bacterium]
MQAKNYLSGILTLLLICGVSAVSFAQANGSLKGTVTLETSGKPVHNVSVTIIQLKRAVETDDNGVYEFQSVPPGTYDVVAHLDRVPDVVQTIQVSPGASVTADFQIRLRAVGEQITVTASGGEVTSFNSIQSVTTLTAVELAEKNPQSLGEALDHELGVSKRTFGPGTSRPVVRGFDGDRVLVLEDGNRIGALGFQSGDHAEPIDVLNLEKLEVVKGPATLLYGSSAIGGVVNAITGHESAHPGLRGYFTAIGGSNNYQGGGSAGIEYGLKNWLFWANGGGQRAGDYNTPIGRVTNSYTREGNASGGFGYYPGTKFLSVDYAFDSRRYGIPFDPSGADPEVVFLNPRRQSIRLNGGMRDMGGFINVAQFSLQYNDYRHNEVNLFTNEINTAFKNKTFNYRGVFDERKSGRWSGSFGLWGLHRDYTSSGEEALAPPTRQNAFAVFALEKLDLERVSFQFGGRFEHNGYNPDQVLTRLTPDRSFNGFSGAIGMRVPTWRGGAFVANYSRSYRAPSLEELYNLGPHGGNATFEIGDPKLHREQSDGIDLSLRHSTTRLRAELNYFYYHIKDFIFLAPTGQIDEESNLLIANYAQGASRYTGAEARLDVRLHPTLWLISSLDYVNATLTESNTPIPRIPPLRGRVGFEATYKGFRFAPEAIVARDQDRLFPTETRTPGYAVFNANASYTIAQQHVAQIISVSAFNIGDRLYRNHLSFIKEFAPEIGRGLRLTYTLRFF